MKLTVAEVSRLVGGELIGPGEAIVERVASLSQAGPGEITFARRENLKAAAAARATAVLVPERVEGMAAAQIVVANPYFAFLTLLALAEKEQRAHPVGIHPSAVVGAGVRLGKDVALGAHAVLGDGCVLGDRTVDLSEQHSRRALLRRGGLAHLLQRRHPGAREHRQPDDHPQRLLDRRRRLRLPPDRGPPREGAAGRDGRDRRRRRDRVQLHRGPRDDGQDGHRERREDRQPQPHRAQLPDRGEFDADRLRAHGRQHGAGAERAAGRGRGAHERDHARRPLHRRGLLEGQPFLAGRLRHPRRARAAHAGREAPDRDDQEAVAALRDGARTEAGREKED